MDSARYSLTLPPKGSVKETGEPPVRIVLEASSPAHKARLLLVSASYAVSWLHVAPSPGLDLHLDPNKWLGMDIARGSSCSLCPDTALDYLGNFSSTCKLWW